MSKKKTPLQSFSKYTIIDLPYDYCAERATEFYADKPLARMQRGGDDQLAIIYKIATDDWDSKAHILISRWEGTKTRVSLELAPYHRSRQLRKSEWLKTIGSLVLLLVLALPVLIVLGQMFDIGNGIIIPVPLIVFLWVMIRLANDFLSRTERTSNGGDFHLSSHRHKFLNAIWRTLIDYITSNSTGRSA